MQLKGQLTVFNYKSKSFKNKQGENVEYAEVSFHDNDGNKLSATVSSGAEKDIQLEKDSDEASPVTGEATFEIQAQNSNGRNFPKLRLVKFVQ